MKVCVGGTFDILHKGHKILLDKALEVAGKKGFVYIGMASDNLSKKKQDINEYNNREKKLKEYLFKKGSINNFSIIKINTKYGLAIEENYDVIIVSSETYNVAEEINKKRTDLGKNLLKIYKIPFVLAEDGKPISTTRIRNKEIDKEGKLL